MNEKPIPIKPGVDPMRVLRGIAHDLINEGGSWNERAGRRILGAIAALAKTEKAKP